MLPAGGQSGQAYREQGQAAGFRDVATRHIGVDGEGFQFGVSINGTGKRSSKVTGLVGIEDVIGRKVETAHRQ